jgi:trans-2,3-dihydro-3-hydroxyanthranilate isomerase
VGLPFLIVELESQDALRRARVDIAGLERLGKAGIVTDLHLYVRSGDEFDIRARMFAPLAGLPEDPATGSANCALAGLLEWSGTGNSSGSSWRIAQGIEMGRPSVMEARACRENDEIKAWIGGNSVLVAAGFLQLD